MSGKVARQRISITMSHIAAAPVVAGAAAPIQDRDAVIVAATRTPIGV